MSDKGKGRPSTSAQDLEEIANDTGLPHESSQGREELAHNIQGWDRSPKEEHSPLYSKNMTELRKIAENNNIPHEEEMDKEELIAAISKKIAGKSKR